MKMKNKKFKKTEKESISFGEAKLLLQVEKIIRKKEDLTLDKLIQKEFKKEVINSIISKGYLHEGGERLRLTKKGEKVLSSFKTLNINEDFFERMNRQAEIISKVTKQIPFDALKRQAEIIQSVQKQIKQIITPNFIRTLSQISDQYKFVSKAASSLSSSIYPIIKTLERLDFSKIEKINRFYKGDFGWIEFISLSYAYELQETLENKDKTEVWNRLISDLENKNFLFNLEKNIRENDFLEKRRSILLRAIQHHKNKDFISSVPLLLAQIEGIFGDLALHKKLIFEDKGRLRKKQSGQEVNVLQLVGMLFDRGSKFRKHTNRKVYSYKLRHPIMHGRNVDYHKEKILSPMLILILIGLIEKIIEEVENKK